MRPADRLEAFSALVEDIHRGARDPAHWPAIAVAMQQFIGSDFTNLTFKGKDDHIAYGVCSGLGKTERLDYLHHWAHMDAMFRSVAQLPPMRATTIASWMGHRAMLDSDVYAGFYEPTEHRHGAFIHFLASHGQYAGIALFNARAPAPNRGQLHQMELIARHLRGALQTADLIEALRARQRSTERILGQWRVALLHCDAAGRITGSAGPLEQLLRRCPDVLTLHGGYLRARDPSVNRRLQHLLRDPRYGEAFGGPTMSLTASKRAVSLECIVLAVSEETQLATAGAGSRRTDERYVLLREAGTEPIIDTHYLRRCLRITPVQADIVGRLMIGESLCDIAAARGSTLETVRSYLKHINQQLGCHSQGQLIAFAWRAIGFIPSSRRLN